MSTLQGPGKLVKPAMFDDSLYFVFMKCRTKFIKVNLFTSENHYLNFKLFL